MLKAPLELARSWLKERIPIDDFSVESLKEKRVPVHAMTWAYTLGGLLLTAFAVQIATGILLLFYYQPSTLYAHQSISYITRSVPGGLLIRNLHIWSANAMVLFIFLHATTTALMRAYRRPRELTWVAGTISAMTVLALAFSGYLLPWNVLSVYATKVGTEILAATGAYLPSSLNVAALITRIIVGPEGIGQSTLSRFFALHVVVLPAILCITLSLHLLLIQLHGMSNPPGVSSSRSERFFPTFLLRELGIWIFFLCFLAALSVVLPYDLFFPYTLLQAYDPLAPPPPGIKPEWYFYFLYYPLEVAPRDLTIFLSLVFMGCIVAAPWIMRLPRLWKSDPDKSPFAPGLTVAVAALMAILTLWGHRIVALLSP